MENKLNEDDMTSNESDYIIFRSKYKNSYSKNPTENINLKSVNITRNKYKNNSYGKKVYSVVKNEEENNKNPFTNLVLRDKINNTKVNIFQRNGERNKLKKIIEKNNKIFRNNNKVFDNNNFNKFLIINKYGTLNLNKNANNQIKNSNSKDKNIIKNGIKKTESVKKISKGQQTYMILNFLNNLKNDNFNSDLYNNNNCNYNYNTIKIPIKNKLTKYTFKNGNIQNIKIKDYKNNIINKNNHTNTNNNESNNSSLIIKQNNEKKLNDFLKAPKISHNNEIKDMNTLNDLSYFNSNYSNMRNQPTNRLFRNNSNVVSLDEMMISNKKNNFSLRELYRKMILNKKKIIKKKKKFHKSILKQNKIKDYLKQSFEQKKNDKKCNPNLISLEQYTLEKIKKNKEISNTNKKEHNYNLKKIVHNKIISHYYNLNLNEMKFNEKDYDDNIFSSILQSLSSVKNKKDNKDNNNQKLNSNSQINILTMIKLNNKI